MNILEKIAAYKREEVALAKVRTPINKLEDLPLYSKPSYSLKRFLIDRTRTGIIAEFKRASPSKGTINGGSKVTEVTNAYASNGASAISVLTDRPSFGGSLDDLITARIVEVPILRKEFIVDEYQIIESKAYGADAILLIAALLTKEEVHQFSLKAYELGLEVLLEIHNEEELDHISDYTDIVGVNNRNLKTFEVSLDTSAHLANLIPKDKLKISESGINYVADIQYLKSIGYDGFLIGETFMKESDPGLAFMQFVSLLNDQQ